MQSILWDVPRVKSTPGIGLLCELVCSSAQSPDNIRFLVSLCLDEQRRALESQGVPGFPFQRLLAIRHQRLLLLRMSACLAGTLSIGAFLPLCPRALGPNEAATPAYAP
jgi:hypothetical protein